MISQKSLEVFAFSQPAWIHRLKSCTPPLLSGLMFRILWLEWDLESFPLLPILEAPGAAGDLFDSWLQNLAFEHLLTSLLGPDLAFPPNLLAEVFVTSCRRPDTLSLF